MAARVSLIPSVDYKKCMACGLCDQVCPESCLRMIKVDVDKYKKAYPALTDSSLCTGCGSCERICPVNAIIMGAPNTA